MQDLLESYKKVWAIGYAQGLLHWDQETYMPVADAEFRGMASSYLTLISKELLLSLKPLVEKYAKREDLDDVQRGIIRVLERKLRYFENVPEEVIKQLSALLPVAQVEWRKAKAKNDFEAFRPYLERIVELERRVAEAWGYEREPYDALLDLHEEGLTAREAEEIFSRLLPALSEILKREGFPRESELEKVEYRREDMERVNREVIRLIGFPEDKFRLDVSAHPFTVGLSPNDVRITTRYEGRDFKATLFSVIHEGGHALYDLNVDLKLSTTPVGKGASLGIHEGQSRFWENVIGRSWEFVELIMPILKRHLDFMANRTVEDVYYYFNTVRPSLIRVDADELTYNFHIAVRFHIERELISGNLSVREAPSRWEELYERYLRVRPKTYSEGILQDIHWSMGDFGYFPTYTLGNVVAAMGWKALPDLKERVASADFESIKTFFRERVWRWGAIYTPKELLRRAYGRAYDVDALIEYLRRKFLA
ncbi:MAG: carboxypeptidase M32 [Sulfolobaceae archaeon]|nr:carboxypeptidase M32 [Sulfolobales archaeon]